MKSKEQIRIRDKGYRDKRNQDPIRRAAMLKRKRDEYRQTKEKLLSVIDEELLSELFERIAELIFWKPKIMLRQSYKASDLKKIDIESCYLAEIRAAQTGTFREGTHINQADVRRMSA